MQGTRLCSVVLLVGAMLPAGFVQADTSTSGNRGHLSSSADAHQPTGRFQLIAVPGDTGGPYLLDTTNGCLWHQVPHPETKRPTFVEIDVENLHWSWGSGAQTILAARVDASKLTDEQKQTMKEGLVKTACGLSGVVLTPGPAQPAAGAASPTK